jgi:hypothetical protein
MVDSRDEWVHLERSALRGGAFLLLVLSSSASSSPETTLSENETSGVTDESEVSTDGGTSWSENSAFEWIGDY